MIPCINNILEKVGKPACAQLPFILAFFVLIGANVHGHVFVKHDMSLEDVVFDYGWMLAVAYLIALLIYYSKSFVIKVICYIIVVATFTVVTYLNLELQTNVNAEILQLLFDTNGSEFFDFICLLLSKEIIYEIFGVILIILLLIFIIERYKKRISITKKCKKTTGIFFSLILVFGIFSIFSFSRIYQCKDIRSYEEWNETHFTGNNVMAHFAKSLLYLRLSNGVSSIAKTKELVNSGIIKCNQNDSLAIVLVIGESFNKQHASVYGYQLQTTPFMTHEKRNGRLFCFNNILTTSNKTTPALRNIFSCNSAEDGENWSDYPYMPAIVKRGGYNVWFWDNQHEAGIKTGGFSVDLDSYLYNNELKRLSYDHVNDANYDYDGDLIDDFCRKYIPGKKDFLIFHLKGQHFMYRHRYPKRDSKFCSQNINRNELWMTDEKRTTIAEYDNATLYNDMVIQKIVSIVNYRRSVMIYLSDHGEEVYDYRDYQGRECLDKSNETNWRKNVMEVPFVIWCSESYLYDNPDAVSLFNKAKEMHFTTDNLCHVIFSFTGIESSCYDSTKNFLSSNYEINN